jgi:hypothetical protein
MNEDIQNSTSSMKMYYFSMGGHNYEYHVMTKSKNEALSWLQLYCKQNDVSFSDGTKIII